MIAMSRTLSGMLRGLALPTLFCTLLMQGAAPAATMGLSPKELAIAMTAYVDGMVEYRQFLAACGESEPANWDEASATLAESLRRAGLSDAEAARLKTRLAAGQSDAASYDCTGPVAKARLEAPAPADWMAVHKRTLENLQIAVVAPPPVNDPRLEAVRAIVAKDGAAQGRMLQCLALVEPQFLPLAYTDWYGVLTRALTHILEAGYETAVAQAITDPARSSELLTPVSDRQAAIADCMGNRDWMKRMANFDWYLLPELVREELAKPK